MTWRPPFFLPIVSSKCRMFYRKNVWKVEKGQTCSDHHFVLAYHVLANFKLWHILHWDQFWIGHLWADGIFTVVILTVEFCTVFLFTVGILTVGNCTVLLGGICTAGILTVGNCTVVLGGNCTAGIYTVWICTVGILSSKYPTSKDLWKYGKKVKKGNGPDAGLEPALPWYHHKIYFDALINCATAATVVGKCQALNI